MRDASVDIISNTCKEWQIQHSERCEGGESDSEKSHNVDLGKQADAEQVCEDGRRIEQGHLLEPKRAHEEYAAP